MAKVARIDLLLEQEKTIRQILQQQLINKTVWAYGSRVKWNAQQFSDLDMVVFDASPQAIENARDAFEESELPFVVSLMDWNRLPTDFQQNIQVRHVVMQENKSVDEWRECKLGDAPLEILDGDRGKNYPSQNELKPYGHCLFLSTKNVRIDGFDFSDCQFISKERDELLRKGKLLRNDVVITTRGTIGNIGFYDDSIRYNDVRINSGMVIIRPNKKQLFPKFNFYLFRKLYTDFDSFVSGSAQPQLPIRDLKKIKISIPPLPEQKAIAGILSSLDDKIDLLHRQNKTLESLAENLFRQWFIEEAKAEWKIGKLGDEFTLTMGQSPPGSSYNENGLGIPMYQGNRDFGFRFPSKRVFTTEAKRLAKPFDTLISVRAPVGEQNMASETCCIGRGVAALRYKHNAEHYTYTYFKLRSLMKEIRAFNNEGTVFGAISKNDFQNIETILPSEKDIARFQKTAKPIDDKIIINVYQIRTLETLRDILLPKLMSGQVRAKNMENIL